LTKDEIPAAPVMTGSKINSQRRWLTLSGFLKGEAFWDCLMKTAEASLGVSRKFLID